MAVYVAIYNDDGELLLERRGEMSGYLVGFWDLPGGHVDEGESIVATAMRELEEETSVIAKTDDLKLVAIIRRDMDVPYTDFIFVTKKWGGVPRIMEPDKCDGMNWFPTDKLPDKLTSVCRMYQQKNFGSELTFHHMNTKKFEELMGGEYDPISKTIKH